MEITATIGTWKSVITAVFCSDENIDPLSLTTRRLQDDYFHKYNSSRINHKLLLDILIVLVLLLRSSVFCKVFGIIETKMLYNRRSNYTCSIIYMCRYICIHTR